MGNLILNRVSFSIINEAHSIFLSKEPSLLFRMNLKHLSNKLIAHQGQITEWAGSNEIPIYFGFSNPNTADALTLNLDAVAFSLFDTKYARELLIRHFAQAGYIVEPYPKAMDLRVFEKKDTTNSGWSIYRGFEFLLKKYSHEKGVNYELVLAVGSNDTYISDTALPLLNCKCKTVVDPLDGFLKNVKGVTAHSARLLASRTKRKELSVSTEPKRVSYRDRYTTINDFYTSQLLTMDGPLRFDSGGMKNVRTARKVNTEDNKMLFANNQTDINATTGMRDFGAYKQYQKSNQNKFIFIYDNSDDANNLYKYFKNGLRHFPGLWSYVGLPPTLADLKLKYRGEDQLQQEFDNFMDQHLPDAGYNNYFAIIIGPFKKHESDEKESRLYYYIKQRLLTKNIPSQFISHSSIRSGSFHYFLPNIAIAMLAKLGGIPWRLKSKKINELVIGFNQVSLESKKLIGSAVFFSNEGTLGKVVSFPESDSESILIGHLRESIERYTQENEAQPPDRLVIHYYKPYSRRERESIEKLINDELKLNIPFAIIEINDTKSTIDICFDSDFQMGMPESGTYVPVGRNEYLMFNNTRYQQNTVRSVMEELPVKVKIHFADRGGFSHEQLISQVYEFSRLYWKGLKQRSQPVTTIYSKLMAEYACHFSGPLPDNEVAHHTPWFL